jgi:MFS family permease
MNPLNWTWQRKWGATVLISMFLFISAYSSTMITPALPAISYEYEIPRGYKRQLAMSVLLLGYAQGPFVMAPLSEVFGRATVLQYANLVFFVFNTACGFAGTLSQMLVFRFLSGVGGSAALVVCHSYLRIVRDKLTAPSYPKK